MSPQGRSPILHTQPESYRFYSAGSSKRITIPVNSTELAAWTLDNKWAVEPGQFAVKVGTSDQTFLTTTLVVR